mgnify:CR=1 FL=1
MKIQFIIVGWHYHQHEFYEGFKELNDNINIPIISEKTEGKILDAIYDSVEEVIKKAILK